MNRRLPWIVAAIFVIHAAAALIRPLPLAGGFDGNRFGRLPVSANGRVQPIDSVARRALLQIRGTVVVDEPGTPSWQFWRRTEMPATGWLLELLTRPDAADTRKVFRIDDPAIITALRLPPAGSAPYYSVKDLEPRLDDIGKQFTRVSKVKTAERTAEDRNWLKLRDAFVVYERLKNSLQPNSFLQRQGSGKAVAYDFGGELATYDADLRAASAARRGGKKDAPDKATQERVGAFTRPYLGLSRAAMLSLVPAADPGGRQDRWMDVGTAIVAAMRTGVVPAPVSYYARAASAYANGKSDEFNKQLADYHQWLSARGLGSDISRSRTEFVYNYFQPLVRAFAIYLVVLLLVTVALLRRSATMYRCAATLLAVAAVLHVAGVLFDMMLQGSLPITNVYSSMVFAGIAAVLLGAWSEREYGNGIGLLAASIAGVATIAGAHSLAPGGAVQLLRAVTTTSFLLAAVSALATWPIAAYLDRRRNEAATWVTAGYRDLPSV